MKQDFNIEIPYDHCGEELTLAFQIMLEIKDTKDILCEKCNNRTTVYFDKIKALVESDKESRI